MPTPEDHARHVREALPTILETLRGKLEAGGSVSDFCAAIVFETYPGLPPEYAGFLSDGRGIFLEPRAVIAGVVGNIGRERHQPILDRLEESLPADQFHVLVFADQAATIHVVRVS